LADLYPHVLNVISHQAELLAPRICTSLAGSAGELQWLSERYAFDLPFRGELSGVRAQAEKAASGLDADINVVSFERRRKKLLVADMDSTIICCECLDEIAAMAGFGARVAAITERAMRGEIAFEPALRERVALLKGLPLSTLERVYAERVRLNPGATAMVATMRAHGAHTLLVSGGFTLFTGRVAQAGGFDDEQANVLLDDGRVLTGEVAQPILGRAAKLEALQAAVAALNIDYADSLAVGDGANDLDMIGRAGLGVAYHAKPIVAAAAPARIAHADLRGVLYLQGYRDDEIVESMSEKLMSSREP
jgi:phosphoserine phosphatase